MILGGEVPFVSLGLHGADWAAAAHLYLSVVYAHVGVSDSGFFLAFLIGYVLVFA